MCIYNVNISEKEEMNIFYTRLKKEESCAMCWHLAKLKAQY
jgi:hypothetical protein